MFASSGKFSRTLCELPSPTAANVARRNHRRDKTGNVTASRAVVGVRKLKEANMPLVLLWVGIPVLLVGGGYYIIQTIH